MAYPISEIAILAAVIAFCITQVHLAMKAKYIVKRSEESWASARQLVSNTEQAVKKEVEGIRVDVNTIVKALETRFDAISLPQAEDIAETVEDALNAKLEAFSTTISADVGNHVMMAFNQVRAQETKAIQAQLDELGVPQLMEEGKAAMMDQLPPSLVQAQRILGMKVSKKYSAEHPIEAQALEMGKLYLMQMMQGQLGGMAQGQQSVAEPVSRGFGVR